MGRTEEHLVHPKDIKKWNSDLPPYHVWDQELVEQLLYPAQEVATQEEESLNTSTASDYSKRKPEMTSSSSSDSPRPPDGIVNIPDDEDDNSNDHPMDAQSIKEGRGPESMLHADDYYEMAKEILQKNREGRRLWEAYENNAKRYIMLAEECRRQERESPVLLPPRLHTLHDRLRQIIPEQRS